MCIAPKKIETTVKAVDAPAPGRSPVLHGGGEENLTGPAKQIYPTRFFYPHALYFPVPKAFSQTERRKEGGTARRFLCKKKKEEINLV